jgi:hypothetical protein
MDQTIWQDRDRVALFEKLIKLRNYRFPDQPDLEKGYHAEFRRRKTKAGVTDEELTAFEQLKAERDRALKQEALKDTVVLAGIKFKNKDHLQEYLKGLSSGQQIGFFFKAMWVKVKEKLKKNEE